jgi:ATP-dependent DNA ligase
VSGGRYYRSHGVASPSCRFHRALSAFARRATAVWPGLGARDQARRLPSDGPPGCAGVRLLTRNGHDWAVRYPLIAEAAGALQVRSFLLDGDERRLPATATGSPCSTGCATAAPDRSVFLFAFDLLEGNGQDLRREPLEVRKRQLASLVRAAKIGLNDHVDLPGEVVFATPASSGLRASSRSGSARAIAAVARRIGSR